MAAKILADKMDEAIRLKTHQERFIDMISHEIRNPLSAVLHCGEEVVGAMKTCSKAMKGMAAGQQRHEDAMISQHIENALDAANTIMYCVQHQKQIVDDVLTLSKLDADLLVVSPVPVQPMVCEPLKTYIWSRCDSSAIQQYQRWLTLVPGSREDCAQGVSA